VVVAGEPPVPAPALDLPPPKRGLEEGGESRMGLRFTVWPPLGFCSTENVGKPSYEGWLRSTARSSRLRAGYFEPRQEQWLGQFGGPGIGYWTESPNTHA
jgi:hypothetical protein